MPLSRSQTKRFVVAFLAALASFIVVATVLILQGQNDPRARARLDRIEAEQRANAPRLRDAAGGMQAEADSAESTPSP